MTTGDLSNTRRLAAWRLFLLPLALFACLSLPRLNEGDFAVDTGWYSAISLSSWRAAANGDPGALWTLRGYGGEPYFNKPPLAFWLHMPTLALFGPKIWAARLPAVLAGAGIVVLTVSLGRAVAGARTGLLAGVVIALSYEFTRQTHAFSLDMWQALFVVATMRALVPTQPPAWPKFMLAGLCLGLALMTKPFVALLALPAAAMWYAITGRNSIVPRLAATLLVALAVAAPWHVSMIAMHGEAFTASYFGREIAARAAGRLGNANVGAEYPWYYVIELLRSYWPWLITLVLSAIAFARSEFSTRKKPAAWLAIAWTIAWLVPLSLFPDKRPRYLLPLYPVWSIASAMWLGFASPSWLQRGIRRVRHVGVIAVAAFCFAVAVAPFPIERTEPFWDRAIDAAAAAAGPLASSETIVLDGPMDGAHAARIYLRLGLWPATTVDAQGTTHPPHPGSVVIRHGDLAPHPFAGEELILRDPPLTVVRILR